MNQKKLKLTRETAWMVGADPVATGKRLKKLRKEYNLTQEELSERFERMCTTPASRVTISNWETGRKIPSLEHLLFLRALYSCLLDELVVSYWESRTAQESDQPVAFFCSPNIPIHRFVTRRFEDLRGFFLYNKLK